MQTDTVLASPLDGVREEVAAGALIPVTVAGLPPLGSDLGVVALRGRSFSPLARYAVDFLIEPGLPKLGQ